MYGRVGVTYAASGLWTSAASSSSDVLMKVLALLLSRMLPSGAKRAICTGNLATRRSTAITQHSSLALSNHRPVSNTPITLKYVREKPQPLHDNPTPHTTHNVPATV